MLQHICSVENIVFQIKVVSFTTKLSICPLTLQRTDETQAMSHEKRVCVRETQIVQHGHASCQPGTGPRRVPSGSGGRFPTHASNMTLYLKGPLGSSDEGNEGQ